MARVSTWLVMGIKVRDKVRHKVEDPVGGRHKSKS